MLFYWPHSTESSRHDRLKAVGQDPQHCAVSRFASLRLHGVRVSVSSMPGTMCILLRHGICELFSEARRKHQ